jgi:hypothetical protein
MSDECGLTHAPSTGELRVEPTRTAPIPSAHEHEVRAFELAVTESDDELTTARRPICALTGAMRVSDQTPPFSACPCGWRRSAEARPTGFEPVTSGFVDQPRNPRIPHGTASRSPGGSRSESQRESQPSIPAISPVRRRPSDLALDPHCGRVTEDRTAERPTPAARRLRGLRRAPGTCRHARSCRRAR